MTSETMVKLVDDERIVHSFTFDGADSNRARKALERIMVLARLAAASAAGCVTCKGTGKLLVDPYDLTHEKCRDCNGTGKRAAPVASPPEELPKFDLRKWAVGQMEIMRAELERVTAEWRAAGLALKKEEASHLETIDRRDEAEECVSDIYFKVIGRSPEWSNNFGYAEALQEIEDAVSVLKTVAAPAASFDPTNHHNALKCQYCNPDGLSFAPAASEGVLA